MPDVVSFPKGKPFQRAGTVRQAKRRIWNPSLGCNVLRIAYEPASFCGVLDIEGNQLNVPRAFALFAKLDPKACWLDVYGDVDGEPVCQTYYSTGDTWWKVG